MSAMYLKDIRGLLGDFAKDFQCPLSSIQPEDLREYLNAKRVGLVSKENRRRMLVVLFNFAKRKDGCAPTRKPPPMRSEPTRSSSATLRFTRQRKLARLLNAAEPDFLPYLALIAFGGVRREELHKGLTWDAINFDRGTITVPASIAKTARKRKIVMS